MFSKTTVRSLVLVIFCLVIASCGGSGGDSSSKNTNTGSSEFESIPFTAWVGETESQVFMDSEFEGTSFLSSNNPDCNVARYVSGLCNEGDFTASLTSSGVDEISLSIPNATLESPSYFSMRNGRVNLIGPSLTSVNRFSPLLRAGIAEFNGFLWVIGGNAGGTRNNDLWRSLDGVTWEKVKHSGISSFEPRSSHALIEFSGYLWLIAGGGDVLYNDIWRSSDGTSWQKVTARYSEPFESVVGIRAAVFDNKLWLYGGSIFDASGSNIIDVSNQLWMSSDGINWDRVETSLNGTDTFPSLIRAQLVSHNEKLFLIGGKNGQSGASTNVIYESADGINWSSIPGSPEFFLRYEHGVASLGGKLFLVGGSTISETGAEGFYNDVWESEDGESWEQVGRLPFSTLAGENLVAFKNKLLLIDGWSFAGQLKHILASDDGTSWDYLTSDAPYNMSFISGFKNQRNNELVLVGSPRVFNGTAQLWTTKDGRTWNDLSQNFNQISRDYQADYIAVNDQIWLIGFSGRHSSSFSNPFDPPSSPDPVGSSFLSIDSFNYSTQTRALPEALKFRKFHEVVANDENEALVISGLSYDYEWDESDEYFEIIDYNYHNDIWRYSETNGWTQLGSQSFPGRANHQSVLFNNRIWMYGGYSCEGNDTTNCTDQYYDDIWSFATDGSGAQYHGSMPMGPRSGHQVVEFQGALWLIGGFDGESSNTNDIWRSFDGVSWTNLSAQANENRFSPRQEHNLISHSGYLYLIGSRSGFNDVWRSDDGLNWSKLHIGEIK